MHNKMLPQLQQACPPFDRAVSVFLDDLAQRRCGVDGDVCVFAVPIPEPPQIRWIRLAQSR